MRITILFIILSLVAEIVGTVGGFGSSVFFVPIANMYFDFKTVLGITALFHLASNGSKIALFRKGLDKRLMLYMGIPAVAFVIVGGVLSKFAPPRIAEICLGIFLIVLSLVFIIWPKLKIKDGNPEAITGGVLSGFLAGFLGTGGAVRGLTMAAFNLEKSVFIATSAMIDMGVDLGGRRIIKKKRYITKDMLIPALILVGVGFTGTWLGKKILEHISQEKFRMTSLILILIIGMITLYGYKMS